MTSFRQQRSVLVLSLLILVPCTQAIIGSDGLCPLFTFVPFTFGPVPAATLSGDGLNATNQGFSQMSAALLAMDHFNNRNDSVVAALANFSDCNVRFDMNQSRVLDTGSITHMASKSLWEQEVEPCAIAGPYNDIPAVDLSVLALSAEIPLVAHRAYNLRVASNGLSPFTSQVFPGMVASMEVLVDFLLYRGRTSFIGVVYSLTESGIHRREALSLELDKNGMEWMSSGYEVGNTTTRASVLEALAPIKDSGYRTVVVSMEFPLLELQPLADAAEQLKMNNGDYFWVWNGIFEPVQARTDNANMTKLLEGSALLLPFSEAFVYPETDPFAAAWRTQGKEAVDRLNAANPLEPGDVGYVFADDDFFQTVELEYGSDYLYDAVMTVGISACLAKQASTDGTVTSIGHQETIRQTVFTGATGLVAFGDGSSDLVGVRDPSTVLWLEFNVLPPGRNETVYFDITGVNSQNNEDWTELKPFVYRDGRTVPPELRDQPNQNYLSSSLRTMGLCLMAVALLTSAVCALWVFLRRNHRVLKSSQPPFLYLIAFGSAIEASAIFTLSNDESYGWTEQALSRACMATPWLMSVGCIIMFSSLFTKLWRVNKVLQFSRRRVEIRHVAGPMIALVLTALVVLSLWTALYPLVWTRVEINDMTGESIGQCNSEHFAAFLIPVAFLMLIPIVLTAVMARKTMDVDEQYAESKWIFAMIIVQLEVAVVAVPVIFLLRDISTDGRYLGYALLFWIFPMSTLVLIFLPKYVAYNRAIRGVDSSIQRVRGQRKGMSVSGFSRGRQSNASWVITEPANTREYGEANAASAVQEDPNSHVSTLRPVNQDHSASHDANDENAHDVPCKSTEGDATTSDGETLAATEHDSADSNNVGGSSKGQ